MLNSLIEKIKHKIVLDRLLHGYYLSAGISFLNRIMEHKAIYNTNAKKNRYGIVDKHLYVYLSIITCTYLSTLSGNRERTQPNESENKVEPFLAKSS